MDVRELAAFREVARQSSFSRAAVRLGFVQSTVSAQIKALEDELGHRLLDRLSRSIALTAAGEAFLPHAERMLELVERARQDVAEAVATDSELTGAVSITAPESLLTYRLPPVLTRFRLEHPSAVIELRPTPIGRFRGESRRLIANGEVDLAFVLDASRAWTGFASEVLLPERISLVAAPSHPLGQMRAVGPVSLAGEPVLLPEAPESGCEYRGQFEQQLAAAGISPRRRDGVREHRNRQAVRYRRHGGRRPAERGS